MVTRLLAVGIVLLVIILGSAAVSRARTPDPRQGTERYSSGSTSSKVKTAARCGRTLTL
jgi:hypothetical protein